MSNNYLISANNRYCYFNQNEPEFTLSFVKATRFSSLEEAVTALVVFATWKNYEAYTIEIENETGVHRVNTVDKLLKLTERLEKIKHIL